MLYPRVTFPDRLKITGNTLVSGDRRERPYACLDHVGRGGDEVWIEDFRGRLHIEELARHRPRRGAVEDRVRGGREGFVVEHAAVKVVARRLFGLARQQGLSGEMAPLADQTILLRDPNRRKGHGETGRDACQFRELAVKFLGGDVAGRAGGREIVVASPPELELEKGAMVLDRDRAAGAVEPGVNEAVEVRAGDEQVKFVHLGRLFRAGLPGAQIGEGGFELLLVVPLAVEQGLRVLVFGGPEQLIDIAVVPPQLRETQKVPWMRFLAEGVGKIDAVQPARGGAADDVDHDVGAQQRLEEPVDAVAAHRAEELLGDSVDVDGEGNPAVQNQPDSNFP